MLHAFFDETGTHGNAEITGVAGLLYDKAGALEFESEWGRRTVDLKKPFRTAACVAQRDAFENWPTEDRERLLYDLAHLIVRTRRLGFVSTVCQEEFNEYINKNPKIRQFVGTVYSLCLVSCVRNICDYAIEHEKHLYFWFEAGNEHQKEAANFIRRMKNNKNLEEAKVIDGFSFITKANNSVLCSADFLAWQWQKQWKEIGHGRDTWRDHLEIIRTDKLHPLYVEHLGPQAIGLCGLLNGISWIYRD